MKKNLEFYLHLRCEALSCIVTDSNVRRTVDDLTAAIKHRSDLP